MQFDGERDLRTPQGFSGGATASRADGMPDDADDSPVLQYLHPASLKGKSDPESSLVPRSKREMLIDLLSALVHLLLLDQLSVSSPSLRVTAHVVTDPSRLRWPSYQTHAPGSPGCHFIIIIFYQTISKLTKASQGGCPPEHCSTVTRLWHVHSSIQFRYLVFACSPFAGPASGFAFPTATVPTRILSRFHPTCFANNGSE